MARKFLCVYHDMLPALENLQPAEVGRLILAALNYDANGEKPAELPGREAILWPMFMSQIDRNSESYKARCETNRNNALSKANRTESQRIAPNRNNRIEENRIEENKTEYKRKEKFTPPTLEEVRAYAKERNSTVNPDHFYEFFNAGNWIDSKGNPVKAWKQKFITWENMNKGKPSATAPVSRNAPSGAKISRTVDQNGAAKLAALQAEMATWGGEKSSTTSA